MIPATGLQSIVSGGFFLKLGPLTIQAKPQMVYAQNTPFKGFPQEHNINVWQSYLYAMSFADIPERFGSNIYKKSFLGNSSIKLNVGPLSFGISNENLWWGPAASNALIMGSHSPGFLHASINTRHPWRTPIGSFEFQLISGFLDSSGYALPVKIEENLTTSLKQPENRYLNAGVLSFQPIFLKGLSFGVIRAVQEYTSWLKQNGQWFLLMNNIDRKQDGDFNVEINRDQQASLFARWIIKKANAEFYVEWGRNDAFYSVRDLYLQPNHSRAYTLGFRKVFPKKNKYHFELYTESTKQKQSSTRIIRDSNPDWYMHGMVTHGMTHRGEVLGAYVGPGSDFQMLRVSMFDNKKLLSIQLERTPQFTDMYERIFGTNDPNVRRWVDYMLRIQGQYRWKNMIFNAQLAMKYSYNYYWFQKSNTETRGMNYTGDLPAAMLRTGILWRL
jgi:hypothetical protein